MAFDGKLQLHIVFILSNWLCAALSRTLSKSIFLNKLRMRLLVYVLTTGLTPNLSKLQKLNLKLFSSWLAAIIAQLLERSLGK